MKTTSTLHSTVSGLILGLLASTPAAAISISDLPLFVTATVDPNVMLLIDTSGSMDNIVWDAGYDNTVTYTNWSKGGSYWDPTSGNVHYNDLARNGCSSGWDGGENDSGTKKCLKLPNPSDDGDTRFSGNYLNYLFETYANNTDLSGGAIPNETRMQVARLATKNLVDQTSGIRFGTTSFNLNDGGQVDAVCGSTTTTVKDTIDTYRGDSWTPLAESLYEVTRYFRGMSSFYNDGVSYTSPIQYRCQHNFSVVVTDGLPTFDNNFATDDPDDPSDKLPDWDGLSPATAVGDYPNFPQYSDGFQPSGAESDEGFSLYLDDIAKFGFDTDFKTSGNDDAGGSYQDPEFPTQNMETYTIGFAQANQMLEDAAAYGNGLYYTADNASSLADALEQAINDAKFKGEASAAAVATNSTRLDTNTTIYQARFDSRDWSGDLLAFGLDDTTGDVDTVPSWNARNLLPPSASATVTASTRNIFTYDRSSTKGIAFDFPGDYTSLTSGTDLNSSMVQSLLGNAPYAWNTTDTTEQAANQTYGSELVDYLRGDTGTGGTYNSAFRSRNSVLGDIVNSNPTFVGNRDFGFKRLPDPEGADYLTYRASTAYKNRPPMVYVGANDGMLHGFNGDFGTELMAYVPSSVFTDLDTLASSTYVHKYFVNGSPRAGDAYISGAWKTILLGAAGAGGRGIFALDVTTPTAFSETSVLGEFTDADDPDVGFVLGQPTVARMADGSWAAIFGNGVNSANNRAILFIINLADGSVLGKFDTGVGSAGTPNGLGAPFPADIDGDRITDVIYAGDLLGNMWKFDVSATNSGTWKIAYKAGATPKPLFTAVDAGGTAQPITVRPVVGPHPDGGTMVYFGTGQFFANGDNIVPATPQVQTFYGIHDDNAIVAGRGDLQQQTIVHEEYDVTFGSEVHDVRVVSDNSVDYATKKGWYLDLVSPLNGAEGERVVVDPLLRNGRMIFSTLIPETDPCGFGGTGWLMEIEAVSGARFDYSVFDLNGDGEFNEGDYVTLADGTKVPVSGQRFKEIISQPVVVDAGEKEHKYVSGSSGNIQHVVEKGDFTKGRQSWRQIR